MTDVIKTQIEKIAVLTLNRPDVRNAYSEAMVSQIVTELNEIERDTSVNVVVLRGAGKSFCAGGDLNAMADKTGMFAGDSPELRNHYRLGIQAITRRFQSFEKPVIASIHGAAVGAGLGLATMCDIRVVASGTKFGAPFPKLGLIPGDGSAYLLARAIGYSRAMELILSARIFDAEEAMRIGLAHHLVTCEKTEAADLVYNKAMEIATSMAAMPTKALQLTKSHLQQSWHGDVNTALHLAAAYQGMVQRTDEHVQAVRDLQK